MNALGLDIRSAVSEGVSFVQDTYKNDRIKFVAELTKKIFENVQKIYGVMVIREDYLSYKAEECEIIHMETITHPGFQAEGKEYETVQYRILIIKKGIFINKTDMGRAHWCFCGAQTIYPMEIRFKDTPFR